MRTSVDTGLTTKMSQEPPPNSRLFILGGKGATEEEFQECFGKFGGIKDVWIVKDKRTNESKGVVYITFSKASEAALAQEEMNGRLMAGHPKPLKVLIANDRREGSVREPKEEEKMLRIFIKIPKTYQERDVEEKFKEFGDVDYVNILREKSTGEPKGLAYVKYHRAYHAALALENCDPSFKPKFAAARQQPGTKYDSMVGDYEIGPVTRDDYRHVPGGGRYGNSRSHRSKYETDYEIILPHRKENAARPRRTSDSPPRSSTGPMDLIRDYRHSGLTRLEVLVPSQVSQEQLYRLFDLIPGLEFCDFNRQSGVAYVRFMTPQCAAYARDKMHGLEYPPGYRISVRYAQEGTNIQGLTNYTTSEWNGTIARRDSRDRDPTTAAQEINSTMQGIMNSPNMQENLQTLVESIKQATNVLQVAGLGGASLGTTNSSPALPPVNGEVRVRYCNIPLPEKQAFAPRDSAVSDRLFIVSQPDAFPEHILNDCFCRFANLIDAYFMPGRNYGYAKFASKESAQRAIETLHGQQICGSRLKVMFADPPKYSDDYETDSASASKKLKT